MTMTHLLGWSNSLTNYSTWTPVGPNVKKSIIGPPPFFVASFRTLPLKMQKKCNKLIPTAFLSPKIIPLAPLSDRTGSPGPPPGVLCGPHVENRLMYQGISPIRGARGTTRDLLGGRHLTLQAPPAPAHRTPPTPRVRRVERLERERK